MHRILFFFLTAFLFSGLTSCEDVADDAPDFRKPLASNGVKFQDGLIYFTDLLGQLITGIDPNDGTMREQFDFSVIATSPDDLVFMDDGKIYWTSPLQGTLGQIVDGQIETLAQPGESVNPIERRPGTDEVYFGFENEHASIGRIDHSSGEITYDVVEGLPSINGFSFAEDGYLYAPLFSMADILLGSDAGVLRIDVDAGTWEPLDVTFPEETAKTVFKATTGVVADGAGSLYVLESFPPAVFKLHLQDLTAFRVRNIGSLATDNIALSSDGSTLAVTAFNEARVFLMSVDGSALRTIVPRK